jgi:hypothetical protein
MIDVQHKIIFQSLVGKKKTSLIFAEIEIVSFHMYYSNIENLEI